jgi:hypothetical protein
MNPNAIIYDVSLVVGLAMVGAGIDLAYGLPSALAVVGALVLILAMFTAHLASRG